jgi:peptide/nickel transport system ATP-binding protein
LSLKVKKGEILGIAGESGSGKTTFALSLMNLVPPPGRVSQGEIVFNGSTNVLKLAAEELRNFRWKQVSMVFQGALNSFNPVTKIGDQMLETIVAHNAMAKEEAVAKVGNLLRLVRLEPARTIDAFPHELSGGMKQRAMIAMSLLLDPRVVILDEPTTALDVISQKHILNVLKDLREKLNVTIIFLTHDLAILAEVAHRVAVMYAGKLMEVGDTNDIFFRPMSPYTMGLMDATPSVFGSTRRLKSIPGSPPDMRNLPPGCPFSARCQFADHACRTDDPALEQTPDGRMVACHKWRELSWSRETC